MTRITSDSELHGTTLPIIKHKYKASAGAHPNLAHLGSSAKKFKLSAYPNCPMQKIAQLAKKIAVAC